MKRGLGDSYPCKPVEFRQGFGFGHHGLWQLRGLAEFMGRLYWANSPVIGFLLPAKVFQP